MEPRVTVAEEIEKEKAVPVWQQKSILAAGAAIALAVIAALIWNFYFRPPPMEVASVEKMAFSLPERPSIAVLPLTNMSGDPEQEYFSDGLTEEIITALSKVPSLFVIARNSTFSYKGKAVKVKKVAEELGVKYVLEGSVRKAGDRVRVTAQLIDALTADHLWAERYDRKLEEIFALQDEITKKIITALQVKLTEGEEASIYPRGTDNLEAYLKFLKGNYHWGKWRPDDHVQARQLAEEVIALDPGYPRGYLLLGKVNLFDPIHGLSKSSKKSFMEAVKLAQKVISMDDSDSAAYRLLGGAYLFMRQHEKSIAARERAVSLSPNHATCLQVLGSSLIYAGRPLEAIPLIEKAIRLNPIPPFRYFWILGKAYRDVGRYEEAIVAFKKAIQRSPKWLFAHGDLTATYSMAGRLDEARAQAVEVLRLNPKFSLGHIAKISLYKNQSDTERLVNALRRAGLPETPPLPLPDKPSIAVLPFVNMSGDPEQEYISDGISEEIITALSKTPKLFVIARTSSFRYKGKGVDVRTVGRELGVRYILEGSVRKSEDRLRITAQLVDAKTGNPLWAERYDREFKDIFAIQDEITLKIVGALEVELTEGETARLVAKGTHNLKAYLSCLGALEHWRRWTREGNVSARRMAKEAIALDPEYARSYELLAATHMMDVWLQTTKSPEQSIKRAVQLAQKAIALDDDFAPAHGLLGFLYTQLRQHDKAIAEGRLAIALNPNGATSIGFLSGTLRYAGECEEAAQMAEKAIRLNPFPPAHYFTNLAHAYICTGRNEEAIAACIKARNLNPKNLFTHLSLAIAYNLSKREEEARAAAAEVLKINPKFSLERFAKTAQYKNQAYTDMLINALRKAGLR
jgi:adenylate cyclase